MGNAVAPAEPPREQPSDVPPPTVLPGLSELPPGGQPQQEEYYGPFDEEGRPHGIGTVLYAEQDPGERAKFQGQWVHGQREGTGVLVWRNGSRYEGGFRADKLSGNGTLHWALGLEYRGEWVNNYAHGRGELVFPNGKKYTGEWASGRRHGWGHLTFGPNDEKQRVEYVGGWVDDLQSGEGVMRWSNGASYQGAWLQGKRHGYGVHTFPTGEKYEGEWSGGVRHGFGRRCYPDGSIYEGGWWHDKKHGQARLILLHGRIVKELWDHGTRLPVPVPQEPQSLVTICIEVVATDLLRSHRLRLLPQEVLDKVTRLRSAPNVLELLAALHSRRL